jgi:uncharacterized PurR-regulated membrane protein YhhQ (DUF165 family)
MMNGRSLISETAVSPSSALRTAGLVALVGFALTGPVSNWLIQNFGTTCVPNGPCLIPVFPGILAPSGVLMVGLALVLRDIVHIRLGPLWALCGIVLGCVISATFAATELVLASTAAFLLSELADFAVFVPLRRRGLFIAAFVSSLVGLLVDSLVFLWVAFGGFEYLLGQVLGKAWMIAVIIVALWLITRFKRWRVTNVPES